MGRLAGKIAKAFESRQHRTIEVPEWGEIIHVYPITLGQLSRINEETDPMKRLIRVILVRSRNDKNELMYDNEDAEALLSQGVGPYGPEVIMRVCNELGIGEFTDEAAAEKN